MNKEIKLDKKTLLNDNALLNEEETLRKEILAIYRKRDTIEQRNLDINSIKTLEEAKNALKEMDNIVSLSSYYAKEYAAMLHKEYISKNPAICWAEYIGESEFGEGLFKGAVYPVLKELDNYYVINTDFNFLMVLEKEKFSPGTKQTENEYYEANEA